MEISFLRQAKFPYWSVISGFVLTTKRPNGQETQPHDQKCHSILLLHFTARLESLHLFGLSGRSRIVFGDQTAQLKWTSSQVWQGDALMTSQAVNFARHPGKKALSKI